MNEKKKDKLGAAAEAFVHQLYGDRILFRRSELQKKFPITQMMRERLQKVG